jgi:hypothetical protein
MVTSVGAEYTYTVEAALVTEVVELLAVTEYVNELIPGGSAPLTAPDEGSTANHAGDPEASENVTAELNPTVVVVAE